MTYGSGDLGYLFRTQTSRSMNDLDKLIQLKLCYANKLGEQKVKEIEKDVVLFSDADQFRIYHAKGRFRGFFSASAFTVTLFTAMNGFQNGRGALAAKPLLTAGVFVSSFIGFYMFWTRVAGFNYQKYNEFQYARVFKMLRNANIKY